MKTINFTREAFVSFLDSVYMPNPDDSDPYDPWDPIGPVANDYLSKFFNPQLLLALANVRSKGHFRPQPRIAALSQALIARAVGQFQLAEAMGGSEKAGDAIGGYLFDVLDDWCLTYPRPKWPFPPRFMVDELRPVDFLVAGAEFQKAAMLDNPLQKHFAAAADKLFEVGLKQLEGGNA